MRGIPSSLIAEERIEKLNNRPILRGDYVLYWMQQAVRAGSNHALEYAIQRANEKPQRVVVAFGLMDDYPDANQRHYRFLLEGLRGAAEGLSARGICFMVERGQPAEAALRLGEAASLIVCDMGYLRHQRQWRQHVARRAKCQVVQVESDAVVPVRAGSSKAEHAARTIRPKIHRNLKRYLEELKETPPVKDSLGLTAQGLDLSDLDSLLNRMKIDRSIPTVERFFRGGRSEGLRRLETFLDRRFSRYAENRNQPQTDDVSHMSPYLHFGHVSPLDLALEVQKRKSGSNPDVDAYLEELLVRRSLAQNFVYFTQNYDKFSSIPEWSQATLQAHRDDPRPHLYSAKQLENGETDDPYWNGAMNEMRATGFMHNYMRMYWGKKILEWSNTPEHAYRTALSLNNKYFVDGRDPNSYANVAWIFGLHDRPFGERPVFGKVRSMTSKGLERKCNIDAYVEKVERLCAEAAAER